MNTVGADHGSEGSTEDTLELERFERDFLEALARGESPTIDQFVAAHPQLRAALQQRLSLARLLFKAPALSSTPCAGAAPALEEPLPEKIDRFLVVERLGDGAASTVLRAYDQVLARYVAIKRLRQTLPTDVEFISRFEREAHLLASLRHPHIVPVFDCGQFAGRPYLVMELVPGKTLDDELARHEGTPMDFRRTADLVRKMADALHYAHERGIIHRDVKPGNILLDERGEPQLADFGLAMQDAEGIDKGRTSFSTDCQSVRVEQGDMPDPQFDPENQHSIERDTRTGRPQDSPRTSAALSADSLAGGGVRTAKLLHGNDERSLTLTHQLLGTPAYMSPEQAAGRASDADARSDVFSLGIVLYRMLTGKRPFVGTDPELREQIIGAIPARPSRINQHVPRDLETICLKSMAKCPGERYQTAQQMADELRRWLDDIPLAITPPWWPRVLVRWCRRNRAVSALGIVAFGLTIFAIVAFVTVRTQQREARVAHNLRAEARMRSLISMGHKQLSGATSGRATFVQGKLLPEVAAGLRLQADGEVRDELALEARSLLASSCGVFEVAMEPRYSLGVTTPNLYWPTVVHPSGRWLVVATSMRPVKIERSEPGRTRKGFANHRPQPVLAYGRTGAFLVYANANGDVEVWNDDVSRKLGGWRAEMPVLPIAVGVNESRNELLLCSADGMLRRFRLDQPGDGPVRELVLHGFPSSPTCARFDIESDRLAVGKNTGHVFVYDRDGLPRSAFRDEPRAVQSFGWSYDGRRLASGHQGGIVVVREIETDRVQQRLNAGPDRVDGIAFSPNDRWLAAGRDGAAGYIWDATTGELLVKGIQVPAGFSADGATLAISDGESVSFWNVVPGEAIRRLTGHRGTIMHFAWSANGRVLATLDSLLTVHVWQADSGQIIGSIPLDAGSETYSQNAGLALTDDGTEVAIALGGVVRIVNLVTAAFREWTLPSGYDRLAYLGDGRFLSVREENCRWDSGPCQTALWEFDSTERMPTRMVLREATGTDSGFISQTLARDGRYYVWVGPRGSNGEYRTEVWDVTQKRCVLRIAHKPIEGHRLQEPGVMLSESGRLLWVEHGPPVVGTHDIWDLGSLKSRPLDRSRPMPVAVSPDERWRVDVETFGYPSVEYEIRLGRFGERGTWLKFSNRDGSPPGQYGHRFSPDGRYLAWGSQSGEITLVDLPLLEHKVDKFERTYVNR